MCPGNTAAIVIDGKKNVAFIESLTQGFVSTYNVWGVLVSTSNPVGLPEREQSIERIFYTREATMPSPMDYYAAGNAWWMLLDDGLYA